MRLAALSRDHDYGDAFRVGDSRKLFDEFQAVHDGHIDITKDEVNLMIREHGKGFCAIARFGYFTEVKSGLSERALHDFPHD
jgi:hypothetical protein